MTAQKVKRSHQATTFFSLSTFDDRLHTSGPTGTDSVRYCKKPSDSSRKVTFKIGNETFSPLYDMDELCSVSTFIKKKLSEYNESQVLEVPLEGISNSTVTLAFDILKGQKSIVDASFQQKLDIFEFAHFLDIPFLQLEMGEYITSLLLNEENKFTTRKLDLLKKLPKDVIDSLMSGAESDFNRYANYDLEDPRHYFILNHLSHLQIGPNSYESFEKLSICFSNLKSITFTDGVTSDEISKFISVKPVMENIQMLAMNNLTTDTNVRKLARKKSNLRNLISLEFSRSSLISANALKYLAGSQSVTNLKFLSLSSNVGSAGSKIIAESEYFKVLEKLKMTNCNIGDDGIAALSNSSYLSNLVDLILTQNDIGDSGVEALSKSVYLTKLKTLGLNSNNITDVGASYLASSDNWSHLKRLYLESNKIGDLGANALASGKSFNSLRFLNLRHNHLGLEGIMALANSSSLPSNLIFVLKDAQKRFCFHNNDRMKLIDEVNEVLGTKTPDGDDSNSKKNNGHNPLQNNASGTNPKSAEKEGIQPVNMQKNIYLKGYASRVMTGFITIVSCGAFLFLI